MFSILTSKLFGGAAIALLMALTFVTVSKNATINELRGTVTAVTKEREAARKDLTTSRANQRELELRLADQNREIERMVREGEIRQKLLDTLRENPETKRRVSSILSRKGESCEDADKLILEVIR